MFAINHKNNLSRRSVQTKRETSFATVTQEDNIFLLLLAPDPPVYTWEVAHDSGLSQVSVSRST